MSVPLATDLFSMSATDLALAVGSKLVSSREIVEAHLQRIEEVNPAVNAITVVLGDRALAEADAADQAIAAGADIGPLCGVPFTIKENIDVLGTPTTQGLAVFSRALPAEDAPIVERLRAAGGIPIGRTNCPNFALRWHTESELWGATVNPWDPNRTPGASSGGEAVSLATGMSPLGLGNDGLGSLRWPAQCCGITVLKPTLGRIPHAASIEPIDAPIGFQLMDVEGPLARRVADLRTAFGILAGPHPRDPWTVSAPLRGDEVPRPIRVAVVLDPSGGGTAANVRDGIRRAADTLTGAGYAVEEIEPPSIDAAAAAALAMLSTPEMRAAWEVFSTWMPPDTRRFMSAFFQVAGDPDPVRTMQGFVTRQSLLRAWGVFLQGHPLILAPICTDVPFEVGTDLEDGRVAETIHSMRMAIAINALGLPAVALPVGVRDGLPQSVQVISGRYREDLCLDAAAALEERLGIFTPIDPRENVR